MPTVLCPLPTNPPHEHELLTSKKSVPYVRCPEYGTHLYFRSDLAKGWLDEHLENGGIRENPIEEPIEARRLTAQEERAARAGLVSDPLVCAQCRAVVELGAPLCPNGHELDWPSEENSGTPLQRAEGRVESDVQRLLRKIEREANEP